MQIWDFIENNTKIQTKDFRYSKLWYETILKSIIWNTLIETFKKEKQIDITSYLESIKLKWKKITIKTYKPIVNTELITLDNKIKKSLTKKLWRLWLELWEYNIVYI